MADDWSFDVNKTAAELLNQRFDQILTLAKGAFKDTSEKIRLRLEKTFKVYLNDVAARYVGAKTLIIRDEPRPLYSFYVPLGLESSLHDLKRVSLKMLTEAGTPALIIGSAGCGKSLFMRHLLLDALVNPIRVPVFIELRRLNGTSFSLHNLIRETLQSHAPGLDDSFIEAALRSGHFLFLLDGFDEVESDKRHDLTAEILGLTSNRYPGTIVIVSSRPDKQIEGWPLFRVFRVKPLQLDDACELVMRLPIDEEVRDRFVDSLQSHIFGQYKEFVSNPLLLSIMLLTFAQGAEIPKKLNLFYMQAYEALFQQHDALKHAFKRERLSSLDIQQFAVVFAAFSLLTYDERRFRFSRTIALEKLSGAREIVGIDFIDEDFLHDALRAACLLVEDGLEIAFSHRSFQEYFVARFLADASTEIRSKLLERYMSAVESDSVFLLLREMRPELLERDFILSGLERILAVTRIVLAEAPTSSHLAKFFDCIDLVFTVKADGGQFGYRVSKEGESILALVRSCIVLYCDETSMLGSEQWTRIIRVRFNEAVDEEMRIHKRRVTDEMSWRMNGGGYDPGLLSDLAGSDSIFSLKCLQFLLKLRSNLKETYRQQGESLVKLLGLG